MWKSIQKKWVLFLGVLVFCLLQSYAAVMADTQTAEIVASGSCGANLTWTLDVANCLTISGEGDMDDYPAGNPPWDAYQNTIERVYIENGVTSIGVAAFDGYTSLRFVLMQDSITEIDCYAFSNCSALQSIIISMNVEVLRACVFQNCTTLEEIRIPAKVWYAEEWALKGCENLKTILGHTNSFAEKYAQENGLEFISLGKAEEELAARGTLGEDLSWYLDCAGGLHISGSGVVDTSALDIPKERIKSLQLQSIVSGIGAQAFKNMPNLEHVSMENSIEEIGKEAFYGCKNLKTVVFPEYAYLTTIGDSAFANCEKLESIIFPKGLTESQGLATVGEKCFWNCIVLQEIELPDTVCMIGAYAFCGCEQLEQVHISSNIKELGEYAFAACRELKYFKMDAAELEKIGKSPLIGCSDEIVLEVEESLKEKLLDCSSVITDNNGGWSYTLWTDVIRSYLHRNEDGSFERVEYARVNYEDSLLHVEQYSKDMECISHTVIRSELSLFGGYYRNENYRYMVFGEPNEEEDDAVEVLRVVKYDMDWNRLDSVSISGVDIVNPFEAGSLQMTESNGNLYIHSSRKKYRTEDGKQHQTNILFGISTADMQVMYEPIWYVSHSFNQMILADGEHLLTAAHGDGNPRAIVMRKYEKLPGTTENNKITDINVLEISGAFGDNRTFAALGGLEMSKNAYLVTGNSKDQSKEVAYVRNIFLSITPKDNFSKEATVLKWLTDYEDGTSVSVPHLVKISDTEFVLMWTANDILTYAFLDQDGNVIGEIQTAGEAQLSDCKPIYYNNQIIWYVTNYTRPIFYTLDITDRNAPYIVNTDKVSMEDVSVHTPYTYFEYTGEAYTPGVYVEYGGIGRLEDEDYTVSYEDNINAGTAKIVLTGKGFFCGKREIEFTIAKKYPVLDVSVNGMPRQSSYHVKVGEKLFVQGKCETGDVSYSTTETDIVNVSSDGMITARKPGIAYVWVKGNETENYMQAKCAISIIVTDEEENEADTGNNSTTGDGIGNEIDNGINTDIENNIGNNTGNHAESSGGDIETSVKEKKKQKITVSKKASKTIVYKAKKLKKKSASFSISAKAKGKITYAVTKYPSSGKKYIQVSKKGKVTLKKKAKKGTYVITVTAAKTSAYKKATKKVTIKVK